MINQVIHGDCFEVLKDIPDNYFERIAPAVMLETLQRMKKALGTSFEVHL